MRSDGVKSNLVAAGETDVDDVGGDDGWGEDDDLDIEG